MLEQASDAVEPRGSTVMSALAAAVWCAWFAPGGLGAHDVRLVMHVHGVHGLGWGMRLQSGCVKAFAMLPPWCIVCLCGSWLHGLPICPAFVLH